MTEPPLAASPARWEIASSRRLTGPNLFDARHGAVLEIAALGATADELRALADAWRRVAGEINRQLGWTAERLVVRPDAKGVQLFTTAPVDALLAATDATELAWWGAEQSVAGRAIDVADLAARVRVAIQHNRVTNLSAFAERAAANRVNLLFDDDTVSVGSGAGSRAWPIDRLPDPLTVEWSGVRDVPIVLVTGSNGKTTTARLIAAILRAAGHVVGLSSTTGVQRDREILATGDYAGPAGARQVLRDGQISAAVLETARGGILRRGLAVTRADVAVVTRVAADHFGEYGIDDLSALAEVKLVVRHALDVKRDGARDAGGHLVLNADDPTLVAHAAAIDVPITWFSLDAANPVVAAHCADGGAAVFLDGETICVNVGSDSTCLMRVAEAPITLDGHARYNTANVLAATAAALGLGATPQQIGATLRTFGADREDNPGRLALWERSGATIVVDFVHNADGWDALYAALDHIPARRRLVVTGQAGDRDSHSLRELAAAIWRGAPSSVFLKEMPHYERGRPTGETTGILAAELESLGAPAGAVVRCPSERAAIEAALDGSGDGDLVILAVHEDVAAATALLEGAGAHVARRG